MESINGTIQRNKMKSELIVSSAKLFGIKPLVKGCRFGIKVNSKNREGGYTKGTFINCKHSAMLHDGIWTLTGFLADNEYNGNNTLEFVVMNATCEKDESNSQQRQPMPKNSYPVIDIDDEAIPF